MGKLNRNAIILPARDMKLSNAIVLKRNKRELSRAEQCKALEYSSHATGLISDLAGDITSAFEIIPFIGQGIAIASSVVSMVGHVANAGVDIASTALDCDDLPFDEIKEVLENKFNEVDKKLDKNTAALAEISQMVSKTYESVEKLRTEMRAGFKRVLDAIENSAIKSIVLDIDGKVEYFGSEKQRIMKLPTPQYLAKISERNGILTELKNYETSKDDSLRMLLTKLINYRNNDDNQQVAIPKSLTDDSAFLALDALFYGIQTYASIMFFLIQQYTYLAENTLQNEDLEKFNEHFNKIQIVFGDFKASLTGSEISLIERVLAILNQVERKTFIQANNMLNEKYSKHIKELNNLKSEIKKLDLPLIESIPEAPEIKFKQPDLKMSVSGWKNKRSVTYAVQYENNSMFSPLSPWSETIPIEGKTNPFIKLPNDADGRNRYIYRKFEGDTPQLVGIVGPSPTEFRDIHRDLYNVAGGLNMKKALNEVKKLVDYGSDVKAIFQFGKNALHRAALRGNKDVTDFLLSLPNSPDINIADRKGNTPLHIAANVDNDAFVSYLLEKGADPNAKTVINLLTPLHIAAQKGYTETMKALIASEKINVNAKDKMGFTPLHYAVSVGVSAVEILTTRPDIDLNIKSNDGLTPLHLAVMNKNKDLVQKLSSNDRVEINTLDKNNMSPLHHASILSDTDTAQSLIASDNINANLKVPENNWTPLHFAMYLKKEDLALELLKKKGIDLTPKIEGDISYLHFAAANGQKNVVSKLIELGLDLDRPNKEGFTPLHLAAFRKEQNMTPMLVDGGASIAAKTNNGSTPLHFAASAGRIDTINFLLSKGADLRASDNDDQMPIHEAIQFNNLDVVKFFIQKDSSLLRATNKAGESLLDVAATFGNLDIVKYLIEEKKMEINEPSDEPRKTPLHIAAREGHEAVTEYLIEKGADLTAVFGFRWPMHWAIENGHLDVVKVFAKHLNKNRIVSSQNLNNPMDFHFIDSYTNSTSLHLATLHRHLDIVKYLVQEKHVTIDPLDNDGSTPLFIAVHTHHYVSGTNLAIIAELLFNNGADPNKKNRFNLTPMEYADDYLKELFKTRRSRRSISYDSSKNSSAVDHEHHYLPNSPNDRKIVMEAEGRKVNSMLAAEVPVQGGKTNKYNTFSLQNPKLTENMKSSGNHANFSLQNMDANGLLFLLDVFLRKFTNEKYASVLDKKLSELETRALALNIMDDFEKMLSSIYDKDVYEEIDFQEVYSKLHRAIMSGNRGKIRETLCLYAEPISKLKKNEVEILLDRVLFNAPNSNSPKSSASMQSKNLVGKFASSIMKICQGLK